VGGGDEQEDEAGWDGVQGVRGGEEEGGVMAWPTNEGRVTAETVQRSLGTRAVERAIEREQVELAARLEVGDGPEVDEEESRKLDRVVGVVSARIGLQGRPREHRRKLRAVGEILAKIDRREERERKARERKAKEHAELLARKRAGRAAKAAKLQRELEKAEAKALRAAEKSGRRSKGKLANRKSRKHTTSRNSKVTVVGPKRARPVHGKSTPKRKIRRKGR
jgi:hypothetical protein